MGLGWLLGVGFLVEGFKPKSIVFIRVNFPSTFTNSCQVLLLLGFWVWVLLAWWVIMGFGVFFLSGSSSKYPSGFLFLIGVFRVGWVLWVGLARLGQVWPGLGAGLLWVGL